MNEATGDVFISTGYGHAVRVVRGATGIITTLFGAGNGFRDGPSPKVDIPGRLQWDAERSALIVCDIGNSRVRSWNGSFAVTWAGNGSTFMGIDPAPILNATMPCAGIALVGGGGGGAFVLDATNHRIRFLNISDGGLSNSVATTVAGSGVAGKSYLAAPPASNIVLGFASHNFQQPGTDVAFLGQSLATGLLVVSESTKTIRTLNCSLGLDRCNSTAVVGSGATTYNGEGLAGLATNVYSPRSLVAMPGGTGFLYFDASQNRVRRVQGNVVTTVAGGGGHAPRRRAA